MRYNELEQKSNEELNTLLAGLREKLRDSRFKVFSRQHKDVRDIRETRKSIANILTLLNQREKKKK